MAAPLFGLGRLVATPGALAALAPEEPLTLLSRHVSGDWGDVPPEDVAENEFSVRCGFRIVSSYGTAGGKRVWVITEADHSSSCILLPEAY
jgi:hypothetical protein